MSFPIIPIETRVTDPFADDPIAHDAFADNSFVPSNVEPVVPEGVQDLLNPTGTAGATGGCCGGGCCS